MNMLINKIPFGLLGKKEQQLFLEVNIENMEEYDVSGWLNCSKSDSFLNGFAYRLRLKEGEWYKIDSYILEYRESRKSFFNAENNKHCSVIEAKQHKNLRSATQEEIQSVKPKDTYVDVEIDWNHEIGDEGIFPVIHTFPFENYPHKTVQITNYPIGWMHGSWVLSGYLFDDISNHEQDVGHFHPMTFKKNKIVKKATHARFVKLEDLNNA